MLSGSSEQAVYLTAFFPPSCCKTSCQELAITEQLTALAKWVTNCFAQQGLPLIFKELSKQTKGKFRLLHLQFQRCVAFPWHHNIWRSSLGFSLTIMATYKAGLTKVAMCDTEKDSEKWAWGSRPALILQTINISGVCGSSYCCWKWSTSSPIAQGNDDKQLNPDD